MKIRKIKDLNRPGNTQEKTDKQLEAARKAATILMLKDNPMKNPEIAKINANKRRGKITSPKTLFKKGNKLGSLNKGHPSQIRTGQIMGIKNLGRKQSGKQKIIAKEKMIKNNPMKNPESVKKYKESRKKNKKLRTKQKLRNAALKNEGLRKHCFLPKVLITDSLKKELDFFYKQGLSMKYISKKFGLGENTIRKILVSQGTEIRNTKISKKDLLLISTNGRSGIGLSWNAKDTNQKEVII